MDFPWQESATVLLIAVALSYVARHFGLIGRRKRASGCGACKTCPAHSQSPRLVSLDSSDSRASPDDRDDP
jgi:hypothetical protein